MAWRNLRSTDPAKTIAKAALRREAGVTTNRVTLMKYDSENPQRVQGHVLGLPGRYAFCALITGATPMYTVEGFRTIPARRIHPAEDRSLPFKHVVFAANRNSARRVIVAKFTDGCSIKSIVRTDGSAS